MAQYTGTTPPAGSSKPTTDPPGSYSLAGASAATLAQPGYYVPTAGASSETKDSPGYYTPLAGATAEILAQAPTISGTVAGQTAAPGDPVTPFSSAIIADPNIDTTDSLSIKLTGAKGTLADGPGFDGLTSSAPGVLSPFRDRGRHHQRTRGASLHSGADFGTTTFALTDTSTAGTSASNSNTTVTIQSASDTFALTANLGDFKFT